MDVVKEMSQMTYDMYERFYNMNKKSLKMYMTFAVALVLCILLNMFFVFTNFNSLSILNIVAIVFCGVSLWSQIRTYKETKKKMYEYEGKMLDELKIIDEPKWKNEMRKRKFERILD